MKSKHLLLLLLMAFFAPWAANAQEQETLTVCDGTTTNAKIPVNGLYTDTQGTTSEFIIPAETEGMSDMEGGTISKVTFYISEIPATWGSPVIQLYLGEVDGTTLSSLYGPSNFTVVKTMVWSNQQSTIEVEFDEPYTYEGGNLLIGTYVQTKGGYKTTYFYGVTGETGCSRYNNGSGTGTSQNFLPKTTFEYTPAQQGGDVCEKPATCEASDVTHNSATLTWTGGSGTYNVEVKGGAWDDWTEILHETTLTTTNLDLQPITAYQARVQSVCTGETPTSSWKSTSFTTECGPVGIGYQCGFEGPNTGGTTSNPLPACWTRTGTSTYYPYAYNSGSHLGSYCLYFSGSSSTNASAMLPEIEGGVNGKRLSFYLKVSNTAVSISVGYLNGENTFVEVEPVAPTTTYSYQLMEVDFANIEGNPTNMVLKFKSTSYSTAYAYIDDLELKETPTCFRPTMVTTATNIGPTTATVSWTPNGDQDHWDVYYCTSPYTAPTASTVPQVTNTADNPCTLTGLTPSTSYRVWVRGNCGSGDVSEWSTNYCTVTTPAYCADMQVQYSTITFSDITYNSANVSWTIAGEATAWKVQCSQDNTFATIDKEVIANTNSAALSGLTAEKTYYVRIAPYCAEAADYTPWSSNKSFSTPESCPAPVLAEPTNTTAYGATLTWTGTSDHYDVMVGEETITTVLDANFENNQIPTGFTNSTTYPWVVTAGGYNGSDYCIKSGGSDSQSSDLSYQVTLTDPGTIVFWAKVSSEANWDKGRFLIDDSQKMEISGEVDWTKYSYELTAGTHTLIWRYYKDVNGASGDDCFYVDDIKITSSTVGTWQVAATNVTESPYVLSNNAVLSPETDYQVKLIGYCPWTSEQTESNAQSFTTASSCETPTGLAESEVTNESAKITWETHGLTTFNLRYRTGSEEWENKNNVACPYTIDGLDGNTTYEVQVQATCNTTEWSTALSFTTKCDLVTDLPWSEDFESYDMGNFSDPCWVNEHIAGSSTYVFSVYTSSNGTNTSHQLQLPDEASGNMIKLVLPGMNLPNNNYSFFIDVYRSNSTYSPEDNPYEGIRIFASTNGEIEGATELAFIPRQYDEENGSIPAENEVGWYTYALPINMSGTCYIVLRGESRYCTSTYMDNFMVASCYPVGTLSLVEYGSTSAKLSWTLKDNTQTAWDVAYKMEGETNFTIVSANTNENYLLEGLTPEKAYTVKVRANCGGGDYGVWSNEINFTTPEACPVPTGLAINEATKTAVTADLSWTGSIDVDSYDIRYRTAAGYDGIDEQFNNSGLPTDWTRYSGLVDDVIAGSATLSTGGNWGTSTYALGSYNAKLNIYGTSRKDWLVTPEINLPTGAVMSFKLALTDYSNADPIEDPTAQADDRFVVLVYADDEWHILREWNNEDGTTYVYNNIATTGETVNDIDISTYAGKTVKFAFYGESTESGGDNDLHIDDVIIGAPIAEGAWNDPLLTSNTTNVKLTDLAGGTKYDVQVRSGCSTSDADWSETLQFTTLPEGTKVFVTAGDWGTATNWMPNGAPSITDEVILRANATIESGTVATAKKITFGATTPTLTINDGGQLKTDNTVTATVKKNISAYTEYTGEYNGGYYLISTPLDVTYGSASTYGMITDNLGYNATPTTSTYDLYKWSTSSSATYDEWRNYRTSSFDIANGTGYLYASKNGVELTFTGTVKANNTDISKTPSYTTDGTFEFNGWNLYANPFVCDAYINDVNENGSETPMAFYRMNEQGDGYQAATGAIHPMEGIFVQATKTGQSFKFTRTAPVSNPGQGNLNINLAQVVTTRNEQPATDNAIIRFGGSSTLEKFSFRENSSKIFIPMEGKDYAVVSAEQTGEIPVSFKAEKNGTYSLSFTAQEVSFSYLHLIDNMTGNDVNLLETPSYSFDARTTDYANRFRLVFATGSSIDGDSFSFINASGNLCIFGIEGEATVQVVDVMGHVLSSETFSGSYEKSINAAPGVYMIRLINGNDVKVQKIVVR